MDSGIKHTLKKQKAIPKFLAMAFIACVFWCCTPGLMPPMESDVVSAQKHWSDATYAQLNEGYHLYKNKCGSCHYLYRPIKFFEEKWRKELPEMSQRAKISSDEEGLILKYLLTMREAELIKTKH